MKKMVVLMKVKPEKRNELLDVMRSLQSERLKVKGIKGSKLYEDEDRSSFRLVDEWETEEDLKKYRQGENFRVFLGALKTLCAEAEITYGPCPGEGGDGNSREAPSKRYEDSYKKSQHLKRRNETIQR